MLVLRRLADWDWTGEAGLTQNPQGRAEAREFAIENPMAVEASAARTWLELVRRLYQATAGETSWQPFSEGLSEALGGAGIVLLVNVPRDRLRHVCVAGVGAETAERRTDALIERVSESPETLARHARGFASAADESGAPNLVHLTAIVSGRPAAAVIAFRASGEPDFSSDERAIVERLVPHLDRVYLLSKKFLGMAQQSTALAEVMDRLPAGILLLDEGGRVALRNRSARRILRRRDGFQLEDGMLSAHDPESNEALQAMIRDVVPIGAAVDAGGTLAARRSAGRPAYPVSVSRLLPGESVQDIVACVLVSDPDHALAPAVELMRSLHDLTRAEGELVGQLAGGRTIEEAARARGVSVNTMRSHLKHVFRKTGTNRQGDLVQLVLRSFVPVVDE
jgi:DNA-binding CsgD family transcriptional regulator